MLLRQKDFFTAEAEASIRLRDEGFLESQLEKDEFKSIYAQAQEWLVYAGVTADDITTNQKAFDAFIAERTGPFENIFVRDAERVFRSEENRTLFKELVSFFKHKYNDYHQGLGLISAFMLLTLNVGEVISIIHVFATNVDYVPEMWRAESIACATDGYVFLHLANKYCPDIPAILEKEYIFPETYVQKWFNALCVYVLSYEHMFQFFTFFSKGGCTFLFQFSLSLFTVFREQLKNAKDKAAIYALLRMNFDEDIAKITYKEAADAILSKDNLEQFDMSDMDFPSLRKELFDKHLKQRLESANAAHAEIDADKGDDEMCLFCNKEVGEYYCKECKSAICEPCRDANAGDHDEDEHMVVEIDDKEWALQDDDEEEEGKEQ